MVNRPPPKSGAQSKADEGGGGGYNKNSSTREGGGGSQQPRRGLEWSLRSMHSIDTGIQHFLSNEFEDHASSEFHSNRSSGSFSVQHSSRGVDVKDQGATSDTEDTQDQTAYEIFKSRDTREPSRRVRDSIWQSLHAPLRTGIVDGQPRVFELKSNITQEKPALSRKHRLQRQHIIINADRSSFEVRARLWLMQFSLSALTVVYFVSFILLNVVFAGFFYLLDDKCCNDPEFRFAEVFAFSVQTSTTIGYGSMSPLGTLSNFLVVILSYSSTLLNTIFAGLLFTKFVTPVINIQFSDVMTLCNVNGIPTLCLRVGNADGNLNPLTDINVRLTYSYRIPYTDHKGEEKFFQQTEELKLLSNRRHGLNEVWTLRHVLDESSPLFGLRFDEHPANKIYVFTLSIDAVQDLTKSGVNLQSDYGLEDIMLGHSFVNEVTLDGKRAIFDYSKMSDTEAYPVWYPAPAGSYDTSGKTVVKTFKP